MFTLYYRTSCPFSLRVRLILAEKRLPFSRRVVAVGDQPTELIEYSAGQVPVLLDGSFAVTDSDIIAEYLEDAFAKPALRPFDARGRAALRMALKRIDDEIAEPMAEWEHAEPRPDPAALARILEGLSAWENKLGDNGLLFALEFSLADAWLLSVIEKATMLGYEIPREWQKTHLWLSRVRGRVSVRSERLTEDS